MVSVDRFSVVSRLLLLGDRRRWVCCSARTTSRVRATRTAGEFYPLVLFATAGMTLITAAADLIVVFLALEILSLSLYVLTGITGRRHSNEAAMKYFLLGAFSSAFFLFGVAWAYGATGTTTHHRHRERARRADRQPGARAAGVRVPGDRVRVQGRRRCRSTVDARRVPGRAHAGDRVHVGRHEGRGVLGVDPRARRGVPAAHVGLDAGDLGAGGRVRRSSGACSRSRSPTSSGCWRTRASPTPASSSPGLTSSNQIGIRAAMFYLVVVRR